MRQTIFIAGSCVSRDAFPEEDEEFALVGYSARSSLGSAFSLSPVPDICSHMIRSNFQKRQVAGDFRKALPEMLVQTRFDTLLVDMIDERFPLFILKQGGLVTYSQELSTLGVLTADLGRRVAAFSDEHYRIWELGWRKFIAQAERHGYRGRILVSRAFWATEGLDGSRADAQQTVLTQRANAHLDRMYQRCAKDLPEHQFISYPPSLLVFDPAHKWGQAPFHYGQAFYQHTRNALRDAHDKALNA